MIAEMARRRVGHGNVEFGNVPILRIDERVEIERADFAGWAASFGL